MYTAPDPPTATPFGALSCAMVASDPSPANPGPPPATVVIEPLVSTLRIRWFEVSAIYKFPVASSANPLGFKREAADAGPPSPANPREPLPAALLIMPAGVILRTRLSGESVRYKLPVASNTKSVDEESAAFEAGPPSPTSNVPAAVLIIPFGVIFRTRRLFSSTT